MRLLRFALAFGGSLSLACSGGDDPNATNPTSTLGPDDTSGSADGSTTAAEGTSAGSQSGTGSTTDEPPADSSSGDETSGSSTGEPCPVGTETCSCDDMGGCEGELICVDGSTCLPAQCDGDLFEPNDDEDGAYFLGMVDDTDSNGGIVSASLHHPGDVDWFSYQGDDDFLANVDPARELVSSDAVRLCKFLECDNGLANTEFECPGGSEYAFSPQGRPGCCAMGGIALPDLNCTDVTEDNAMVYLRIDQPADSCVTYSVSYHY